MDSKQETLVDFLDRQFAFFDQKEKGFLVKKTTGTTQGSEDLHTNQTFQKLFFHSNADNRADWRLADFQFQKIIDQTVSHHEGLTNLSFSVYEFDVDRWFTVHFQRFDDQDWYSFENITEHVGYVVDIENRLNILESAEALANIGGFEFYVEEQKLKWSKELFVIHELEDEEPPGLEEAISFYKGDNKAKILAAFEACLKDLKSYDIELDIETSKGNVKHVRTLGKPILSGDRLVKISGVLVDITVSHEKNLYLDRLINELNRSNKELEDFAYVASHDLQEPVRMITAFGDLLEDALSDRLTEKEKEFFGFIKDGTNRITQMIQDLLMYSRVNTEQYNVQVVDANECLQTVLFQLAEKIDEKNVKIESEDLPKVKMSKPAFERILNNVIENAIKYNDNKDPMIKIGAIQDYYKTGFFIKDNGPGIDPKLHQDVFKIFRRIDTDKPGSGMGMAIVQRIIKKFNGDVWLESAEGEGTAVYFTFENTRGNA